MPSRQCQKAKLVYSYPLKKPEYLEALAHLDCWLQARHFCSDLAFAETLL